MGIRFYCPNGHKLNVKVFLAGRRGICPHCDARFDIPHESQTSDQAAKVPSGQSEDHPAASIATAVGVAAAQPAAAEPSLTVRAAEISSDPIAEAPEAVWYIRPPAGGQFGPARGDVLRQWIAEGRVSADSMVWREGWPDWKTAGPIFPDLNPVSPINAPSDLSLNGVPDSTSVDTPPPPHPRGRYTAARSRGSRKSLALVVCLGLLIVVLLVFLVQVLLK